MKPFKYTSQKARSKLDDSLRRKKVDKYRLVGISGVYFLTRGNIIIYIGESACVYSRILQHEKEGIKDFDSFSIKHIPQENKRKSAEKYYIRKHRPICNLTHNPDMGIKSVRKKPARGIREKSVTPTDYEMEAALDRMDGKRPRYRKVARKR